MASYISVLIVGSNFRNTIIFAGKCLTSKVFFCRHFSNDATRIKECCAILKVTENCSLQELRDSYITLAKMYHPDGETDKADAHTFAQIESAYKTLRERLLQMQGDPKHSDAEEDEQDYGIKHITPQHRHYLSYEGVGFGTVGQRQRQYQKYKVNRAVDTVHEHRVQKLAAEQETSIIYKDKKEAKKHKIRNAIDRLVEDLIQESMAKGDFDNLSGKGKPLKHTPHNPYIDSVTQKLNEVLINNGFTPEWILLEKEIRQEKTNLRGQLQIARAKLGPLPLTDVEFDAWTKMVLLLQDDVDRLNSKINKYNLVVPTLQKQTIHFLLKREADKILQTGTVKLEQTSNDSPRERNL